MQSRCCPRCEPTVMPRPRKIDDYLVRRLVDLFHYADSPSFLSQVKAGDTITLAEERVVISGPRDIPWGIGQTLCDLRPEKRTYVLRLLINVLEGKKEKERKTPPDEIALVRIAWRKAKAKLKGLYRGDNPTFKEADTEFYRDNRWHLDRRALKDAGCPIRPDKRGVKKKLPRL
jgi:hypothetical protein